MNKHLHLLYQNSLPSNQHMMLNDMGDAEIGFEIHFRSKMRVVRGKDLGFGRNCFKTAAILILVRPLPMINQIVAVED
jgi:hypothetical protein